MYRDGAIVYLLFICLVNTLDSHVSAKIHSMILTDDVSDFSRGTTAVSPFSDTPIPTNIPATSNKQEPDHQHEKSLFRKEYETSASNGKKEKRNADKDDSVGVPRGKQKKAKELGRLLLNNDSTRKYEDIHDDYFDDDDDDYFKGANVKKMNWEDYQNEDGPSVMELIALDARHKKHSFRQEYPLK
ncbi:uncharacterized protein LOC128895570 isoform X2 [Hylaeus anthracinus]|uniref:uncharacterized protein LOC128895570 isoform X2 n=1 Tax=Hylaeus anthracinus TaxID=313031 RepID=UPI0023B8E890|nr:uncharacterized protein LOC128895570 isoform X2 [Hylaeus anthracinus]